MQGAGRHYGSGYSLEQKRDWLLRIFTESGVFGMSWWPFGEDKNNQIKQEPQIERASVTVSQAPSQPENVKDTAPVMAAPDMAKDVPADDPKKDQIDALVRQIEGVGIEERLEFLKAEAPLRELASFSLYAEQEMKALRKRFFDRLQAKTEAENLAKSNEQALASLITELTDHQLIEEWFENTANGPYEGQTVSLVLDLREGRSRGVSLADVLEQRGNARTGYKQRHGSQNIRTAAELIERKFFKASKRLFDFFAEREVSVLPNFRRVLATAKNKFGDTDYSIYIAEVTEFCDYAARNTDLSSLSPYVQQRIMGIYIFFRIEELKDSEITEDQIPVDGFEFEVWCAEQIQRQGWHIEATPKSGDQGVDIVVRRDGLTVAVQCKRYSSPIGNAAVQEVHAGRTFISAKGAVVVGTGGFTKAARNIAAISKVELLDAMDIARFSELFGFKSLAANPADEQTFVSETYGQREIIKTVFFGLKNVLQQDMSELIRPDTLDILKSSFDASKGTGSAVITGVQAAQILVYASIVFTGKIQLEQRIRDHFANQKDINTILVTDPEVTELMWYQFYDATHMEQIVEAFKSYASQFGVHQITYSFLSEFE